jgi:hypothetical protein
LGFTLYDNNNKELCYLEYNTGDLCLGSYYQIPSSQVKSRAGFKMSDVSSGINAVYRILTPYAADAKTPFNLTSTVSDFYFTLGVSNGTTTLVTNSTGLLDISSFFNNYYTKTDTDTLLSEKQGTLVSGTDIKTINGNSILGSGDLEIDGDIYYDGAGTGSYSPSTDTINDCIDSLDSRITALGTPNEIASITAVESNVSGGNNTVTITETNGTSKTFNVKNGVDGVSLGEVALMQTTGDSEESVMSQKAVTEYGRRVTAEDLDGTSNWIREKLTEEGWEFEKYVNSSGTLSARASYCASTFIPVSNIKEHSLTVCYMYSTYSTSYFCFYDSNKNYITGLRYTMNSDNSRTVSIDTSATWDDVAYIRITCNPNKLSECYIKDNTANEYVWRGNEYIEPFCNNFLINSGVFRNTFVSQEEGTSKTKVMSQDALSGLGFANRFTNNITPCKGITTTNQSYRTIGLKLNDKQKQLLEDADTITIRISSKKFWESNNYAGVQGAFWFVYNSAGGFAGMSSCGINNALATLSNVRYYPDHLTFVIDMVNGVVKTYWEKTLLTTFTNDGYKKENVLGESGILKIFNGNTQIPFVLYQFDVYDGDITPVFGITQMKDYLSFDSLSPIIKGNYTQTTHHGQMAPSTYGTATGYTIVQASASSDGYKHITSNSSTTWYPAGYYINHADVGRLIKYCVHIEVVSGAVQIGLRSTSCNSTTPTVVNETTGETVTASNVGVGTYKVIGWGYGVDTWCLKYVSGSPMEVIIKETDWHLISCVISLDCRNLYNGQLYDKEVGMFYPKANTLNEPLSSGRVFVNPTPSYEEFNPIETSVSNRPGHTGQMAITNNNVYISVNKDVWKQINNS